jgi:uncharacterized lipoprotein YmbA
MSRNSLLVIVLLVLVLLGLTACGSNPVDDNYYSLVLAADDVSAPAANEDAKAHLVVGPVELPEYLDRQGIAMQIGANQVQTANHHLWAEPLEEAISKVLVRDIASLANGLTVDRDAGRWTDTSDCRLRIEFDKFHATDRARVVSSGRYWLSSADSEVRQEFDVAETISADGYAYAVAALRRSLDTLARQIAATIENHSRCSGEQAQ